MKINRNDKIILVILTIILVAITCLSIQQNIYYSNNNVAKRRLNYLQEKYNIKLPQNINVEYKYEETAVDGSDTYYILSINENYKLSYQKQYDGNISEENYKINIEKSFDSLEKYVSSENLPNFNDAYDWFSREEKGDKRFYNFYIVYVQESKIMYLYYEITQYKTYKKAN